MTDSSARGSAPLLSIIIPCYNSGRFIGGLLQSLAAQIEAGGLKGACEIIAVNDGSKDSTEDIIKESAARFPFIRLASQENKGVSAARNAGMDAAKGEYLYFLDSDDTLEDGAISHFARTISQHPDLDLYCFAYTSVNGGKTKKYQCPQLDGKTFSKNDFLKAFLSKAIPLHVCSSIVRKELAQRQRLRFPELTIGEDIVWLLRVCSVMGKAYFSNRSCFVYRIRDDSAMQGYKGYSAAQFRGYEAARDICISSDYQTEELRRYSNFWLKSTFLITLAAYLRADFKDADITQKMIDSLKCLRLPHSHGRLKQLAALKVARLVPFKLILRMVK